MSEKRSYGVIETAVALGLSRSTVYRLIQRGELATFKVGARTLISRRVLDSFVDRSSPA